MDLFCEFIVKRKKTTKDIMITIGIILAAWILSFIILMFNNYLFGFGLLLIAAVLYGAYILIKFRSVEFEYTLTNSEMDIDKIFAKRKRKRLISIDFRHIDICAKIDDPMHLSEYNNNNSVKVLDCTGFSDNDIYFVDFQGESGKTRVLFQPTDKMKNGLKLVNPRLIHIA